MKAYDIRRLYRLLMEDPDAHIKFIQTKKAAAVKRHYKRVRSMQLPKKLF